MKTEITVQEDKLSPPPMPEPGRYYVHRATGALYLCVVVKGNTAFVSLLGGVEEAHYVPSTFRPFHGTATITQG